jgi:hypothetical protein
MLRSLWLPFRRALLDDALALVNIIAAGVGVRADLLAGRAEAGADVG